MLLVFCVATILIAQARSQTTCNCDVLQRCASDRAAQRSLVQVTCRASCGATQPALTECFSPLDLAAAQDTNAMLGCVLSQTSTTNVCAPPTTGFNTRQQGNGGNSNSNAGSGFQQQGNSRNSNSNAGSGFQQQGNSRNSNSNAASSFQQSGWWNRQEARVKRGGDGFGGDFGFGGFGRRFQVPATLQTYYTCMRSCLSNQTQTLGLLDNSVRPRVKRHQGQFGFNSRDLSTCATQQNCQMNQANLATNRRTCRTTNTNTNTAALRQQFCPCVQRALQLTEATFPCTTTTTTGGFRDDSSDLFFDDE